MPNIGRDKEFWDTKSNQATWQYFSCSFSRVPIYSYLKAFWLQMVIAGNVSVSLWFILIFTEVGNDIR